MARIRLVRHGEATSAWGDGEADPGLSAAGRAQAEAVAERLAGDGPLRLLTSPLRRCRDTAEPLATRLGLEPEVAPAVAEVPTPPGLPAGERPAWLRAAMGGAWAAAPGGDYARWRDGVAAFLAGLEEDAVVFTHFVAVNAAVSAARGDDRVLQFRPGNGSVTTLRAQAGGLVLESLGSEVDGGGRVL